MEFSTKEESDGHGMSIEHAQKIPYQIRTHFETNGNATEDHQISVRIHNYRACDVAQ